MSEVAALRVMPALAVVATSLLLAPDALANCCAPKSGGSPNANSIHTLYVIVLIVAAIVFVAVEGALFVAVFRFRAKKHPVAHQTHGNTKLEIGWTSGAAVILLILTVVTFIKLPSIINAPNSDANGLNLSASVTKPVAAERQGARRLRPGPSVHLALHVRRPAARTTRSSRRSRTRSRRWSCRSTPRSC